VVKTIDVNGHILTCRTRRDRDVNTSWTEEHLIKDIDDLSAFLEIPLPEVQPTDLMTNGSGMAFAKTDMSGYLSRR